MHEAALLINKLAATVEFLVLCSVGEPTSRLRRTELGSHLLTDEPFDFEGSLSPNARTVATLDRVERLLRDRDRDRQVIQVAVELLATDRHPEFVVRREETAPPRPLDRKVGSGDCPDDLLLVQIHRDSLGGGMPVVRGVGSSAADPPKPNESKSSFSSPYGSATLRPLHAQLLCYHSDNWETRANESVQLLESELDRQSSSTSRQRRHGHEPATFS